MFSEDSSKNGNHLKREKPLTMSSPPMDKIEERSRPDFLIIG